MRYNNFSKIKNFLCLSTLLLVASSCNKTNGYSNSHEPTFTANSECFTSANQQITLNTNSDLSNLVIINDSKEHYTYLNSIEEAIGNDRPLEFISKFKSNNSSCKLLYLTHQGSRNYEIEIDDCGKKSNYEFSHLGECSTNNSTYEVTKQKAFIHDKPLENSITKSYFIQSDKVEAIEQNDEWVKVSYKDNTKNGWLRKEDLKLLD